MADQLAPHQLAQHQSAQHQLLRLDHVNLRTARVDELAAFYCDVLGLARGQRPPFPFGGAWLYCGDQPVVHLVAIETGGDGSTTGDKAPARPAAAEPSLSHFAFTGTGMAAFIARLEQAGVPHAVARLPGSLVTQVNLRDPDGNALHVDFAGSDG